MQIFPVNFSSLKRFQKTNKSDTNKIKQNKEYKACNTTIDDEKKQRHNESKKYHSERMSEKNNGKKYISRIYSEKKVKISFGIVKEICFMNNG